MKRCSLPRPRKRGRIGSTWVLLVAALASGCLVSFDGYQPIGMGDAGDDSGGGTPQGGKSSGGKSSGASDAGGRSGEGATPPVGGEGGERETSGGSTNGGGATGGGGSTNGGKAGSGGAGGGGGSSGGGTAGTGGQPPQTCPVNLEGPPMIEIPKPGGGFFCMDRTEVPAEDYATFLASAPSTSGQSTTCTWNTTYEPDTTNACVAPSGAYDPEARPRAPVACIDWCDAKRYCEWAGKRLCGGINGGSNPVSKFADADSSQWYRACSKAGAQNFPYGDAYQSQYCVGLDNSGSHPSSVAAAVACEGGYPGLFDMSGNVAEWEDSCNGSAGSADNCLIRGGNMLQAERTSPSLLCNSSKLDAQTPTSASAKRNAKSEHIGFRCCLDP